MRALFPLKMSSYLANMQASSNPSPSFLAQLQGFELWGSNILHDHPFYHPCIVLSPSLVHEPMKIMKIRREVEKGRMTRLVVMNFSLALTRDMSYISAAINESPNYSNIPRLQHSHKDLGNHIFFSIYYKEGHDARRENNKWNYK